MAWFYDQELSRHRVARLAGIVQEAADGGDETADRLLDQAARHLVRAALAVDSHLEFPGPYPLVLAGGVYKACPSLYDRVEKKLDLEKARVVRLKDEPAVGAVTLALEMLE